jgi:outer membrane immunogenic protein
MRKYLILCAAIPALMGASALAAELPVKMPLKAPPPPPPPVYDWSGFYVAGSLGWAEQSFNWGYTPFPGLAPFSLKTDQPGAAGVHAGLQWQWGWLVLGGEVAAIEPTVDDFSLAQAGALNPGSSVCTGNVGELCEAKFGTILTYGGKAGIAWGDTLIYGVGGGASGRVDTRVFDTTAVKAPLPLGQLDSANGTNTGWYAGVGLDYMMLKTQNADMIVGIEWEHIDLGSKLLLSTLDTPPSLVNARTVSAKEDIIWGKLTFKFNWWPGAPTAGGPPF